MLTYNNKFISNFGNTFEWNIHWHFWVCPTLGPQESWILCRGLHIWWPVSRIRWAGSWIRLPVTWSLAARRGNGGCSAAAWAWARAQARMRRQQRHGQERISGGGARQRHQRCSGSGAGATRATRSQGRSSLWSTRCAGGGASAAAWVAAAWQRQRRVLTSHPSARPWMVPVGGWDAALARLLGWGCFVPS